MCFPSCKATHFAAPLPDDLSCRLSECRSLGHRSPLGRPGIEADRLAEAMVQQTRLPMALARVLVARGVAPADAARFLDPKLADLLPDPRGLKDMAPAAARFLRALKGRERIAVFADYDVDGGSSAALLLIWLRAMGHQATLYIPTGSTKATAPNVPAMEALAATHDLIICVDCGTLSHDPVAAAARAADVVILDHHLGGETLPPALAVVNPNRQDETGDLAHLCAASVVFLMLVEVNRLLRDEGAKGPDLMAMLDLVALATVADVAPLTGVNRALVRQGLKVLARRERVGLQRACRCGAHGPDAHRLSSGLPAGPARQCRGPDRRRRSWCPPACHRRCARGGGTGRTAGSAEHRAARYRSAGA